MIQDLKILDFHCHFPNRGDMFPGYPEREKKSFEGYRIRDIHDQWRSAFNFSYPEENLPDIEAADKWIDDMNKKGVEKVCWVSGGGNERLAAIVKRHPDRFIGMAHNYPDEKDAADKLEHAFRDLKLKGYKILGPSVPTSLSDSKYDKLWEVCEAYDVPVLIHFGLMGAAGGVPNGVNISPLSIADAAFKFPKVRFVIPHFGCTHIADCLQLCWTRPNVMVDTSGSNQWIRWLPYQLNLEEVIRKYVETIGTERIIFGTDSSWMPRGFATIYLEEQHKIFRFLGLSKSQLQDVFYNNAACLLKV